MNEYDSKRIYDFVEAIGYKKTESVEQADCHVLNTCHIREKATDKVYHHVGRIKKKFRNKKTYSYYNWLCGPSRRRFNFRKREIY